MITIYTRRWILILAALAIFTLGILFGQMDLGRNCHTDSSDGGLTQIEVCTRNVSP